MDTRHPANRARPDDGTPAEAVPSWPSLEAFHAESDIEDAEAASGVAWPQTDIVAELRQTAASLRARISDNNPSVAACRLDRAFTRAVAAASQPVFASVWDNADDDAYNVL